MWLDLFLAEGAPESLADTIAALTPGDAPANDAILFAALDLGLCVVRMVRESERRWRHAAAGEAGLRALCLPVGAGDGRALSATLSLARLGEEFTALLCDLIAIPLDGARAVSLSGDTAAVGRFAVTERGRAVVFASGLTWLQDHFDEATRLSTEVPTAKVADLIAAPDSRSTLMLDPLALEWRPSRISCVVPASAKEIAVVDSRSLAETVDRLMRKKEPQRRLPAVLRPRSKAGVP